MAKKQETIERIVEMLQGLPERQLRSVADYITYLNDKAAWVETQEILSHEALTKQISHADAAWEASKLEEYEDWDEIRKD